MKFEGGLKAGCPHPAGLKDALLGVARCQMSQGCAAWGHAAFNGELAAARRHA